MNIKPIYEISGEANGERLESRVLEEQLQQAVAAGHRHLLVKAMGQHGIGGRLWKAGDESVHVTIYGQCGQRVGAMGYPNTYLEIMGPASDDVGWLNTGAKIVIHGNAGNGVANAMAQGKIYVAGNLGSRAMTMTKQNPRMAPPELWVLGSVGDYFGEFMAGGIAVVCGYNAQSPGNVLGYRPFVGMVGGKVFFRGPHSGYSRTDARIAPLSDKEWLWLTDHMKAFLEHIKQPELFESLSNKEDWQLIHARKPHERVAAEKRSMKSFKSEVWEKELGQGGLIGDLTTLDRSVIPIITTNELRRFVPVWENKKYASPCEASCPTGIPVQQRWQLIREGRMDEAVNLALSYTPFPAAVCGYLCPNLCMQSCTRHTGFMAPLDVAQLGKASIQAKMPDLPEKTGKKIAVIGGGPGGLSVAWQLTLAGHEAVVFDMAKSPGGKIASVIPESRMPKDVLDAELARIKDVIPEVHLQQKLARKDFEKMKEDFDFVVIAAGAHKPRTLPVPGNERMIPALEFLEKAKTGTIKPGKRVVVIGAGNVGCDVATEAHRLGATDITLIDIMEPASFGKEREEAEKIGAKFQWPCFTKEITAEGVILTTGELVPADTVVISIGDAPNLEFLPEDIPTERGFILVNDVQQTASPRVFAIGDAVKPGLITDSIGAGRRAAKAIDDMLAGRKPSGDSRKMIDKTRITLEYFDPRITDYKDLQSCGTQCSSCGACRDCGICEAVCPQAAISRAERPGTETGYEYIVNPDLCIGCGFCAGACPCGIWALVENDPLD
jgi:NADPH-dependent glutamate synthase beta subunit-like oxidoreductase/glutamate synthase domain-containing protein 3/NAD-dependent dihydropyrimidine dehydrogenase PreA subunit